MATDQKDLTGRQLDAWLAERVMGWVTMQDAYYVKPDGVVVWFSEWNPLSSMADAWLVVEKLTKDLSCDFKVHWLWAHRGLSMWVAEFIGLEDAKIRGRGEGSTAPESISRAAYRAVEGQHD